MTAVLQSATPARHFTRLIGGVLLRAAATTLICGLLSAALVRFSPGFGLEDAQLDARLSSGSQNALRHSHDEERNPAWFYVTYVRRIFTGDFGFSRSLNQPIRDLLAQRAPETATLIGSGIVGAWLIALSLAIIPTFLHLPRIALVCTLFSGVSASIPAGGVALLLFRCGGSATWIMAVILFPRLYQYLRNLLQQAYGMPHVLLAKAKGLGECRILLAHVLRPTRAQLLALAAVSINMAFGAAVAIEAICDLPGIGQLAWKAALARDIPVLVILTMIISLTTQTSNLVAEACSPTTRSRT
jgi:peptide/nickel transport system permease protein